MKLRFKARAGCMVNWPGVKIQGQLPRYVGRHFVPSDRPGVAGAYTADKEDAEIDPADPDADHLVRQCRKGGLWASDKSTAEFCGVELPNLKQDADGEWIAERSAPKAAAKAAAKES